MPKHLLRDIPPEARFMVFKWLFQSTTFWVHKRVSGKTPASCKKASRSEATRMQLAIFLTCKTFHAEAGLFFLRESSFRLHDCVKTEHDLPDLTRLMRMRTIYLPLKQGDLIFDRRPKWLNANQFGNMRRLLLLGSINIAHPSYKPVNAFRGILRSTKGRVVHIDMWIHLDPSGKLYSSYGHPTIVIDAKQSIHIQNSKLLFDDQFVGTIEHFFYSMVGLPRGSVKWVEGIPVKPL